MSRPIKDVTAIQQKQVRTETQEAEETQSPPPSESELLNQPAIDDDEWKLRQELYNKTRAHLDELRQKSYEEADKIVVTFSSAFLGVSIGFVKDIVPLARVSCLGLLITSWGLFGAAILTTLGSYWTSRKAIDAMDSKAQRFYLECDEEAFKEPDKPSQANDKINLIAAGCFVMGVFFTGIFAAVNVSQEAAYQRQYALEANRQKLMQTKPVQPKPTVKPAQ